MVSSSLRVMQAFPVLFSPVQVGRLRLPNRVVLSAMTTGFGFEAGAPTAEALAYYAARSEGVGLATVGFSAVRPEGRVENLVAWLWPEGAAEALAPLAQAICGSGARAAIQLGHGGRQVSPRVIGETPVAPSSVAPEAHVAEAPRALDTAEVADVVAGFAAAAAAAADAGFEAVEIHAGHGYLIWQFLSAEGNQRSDRYGGATVAARARFGMEVVQAVRAAAPEVALLVRINGSDLMSEGAGIAEAVQAARCFEEAGADGFVVSAGVYGSVPWTIPLLDDPEGCFAALAGEVRRSVGVPVVAVGRISTPEQAETLLADGTCDAVALGRALLADPQWVTKAQAGRSADIRPCIATVQGCAGMLQHGEPISCSVNPDVGREGAGLRAVSCPGRVLVVGGGPAGMEAARVAATAGAEVTLLEREEQLGGALRLAARTPPLAHMQRLVDWYVHQLEQLGVDVRTGTSASPKAAAGYDRVVLATGAVPELPVVEGYELLAAWTAHGLLAGQESTLGTPAAAAQRLVLVGRGQRALAVACWCLGRGIQPLLLADGRIGHDTAGVTRRAYRHRLDGVPVLQGTLSSLQPDGAVWQDAAGEHHLPADGVVLVEPLRPELPAGVDGERIGDAKTPRALIDAVAEGRDLWHGT